MTTAAEMRAFRERTGEIEFRLDQLKREQSRLWDAMMLGSDTLHAHLAYQEVGLQIRSVEEDLRIRRARAAALEARKP